MPRRDHRHDTELPDWFSPAFAHLDATDRRRVITLWQNEPVLRELAARLDKFLQPDTLRCPLCHSTRVYHVNPSAPEKLHCKSCPRNSSLYHGTPFSGLMHALHHRLYAILLTLWGCWRKEEAVWLREPLLREVAGELDAQNPLMGGVHACVRCGSTGLSQYHTPTVITTYYYCAACKSRFSEAEGTVFYNIPRHFWYRLYTVLVCLWTSWKQAQSLSVCQIGSNCGISAYRKRLRPLIDACRGDNPVTPRPRKMLGFSPAEQGVSCISCSSGHLVMEGVTKISPDNPLVVCRDCGARFRLQEWLQARDAR